ncbi:porin [Photobacterium sanctipauli]|uniref:Porin n=1 Tax=Photobacterium sanctipauli TaxID=1342794 RepID=A0A2T3NRU0_9GAMM|nr:porin [Photobacterium sanctipauli]PSW18961.1 porin [Photobacterium sanctipauli]
MNKKLLAIALSAAALSSTATAAEIYSDDTYSLSMGGRFDARAVFNTDAPEGESSAIDRTRIRLNLGGNMQLTDNLYGIGFWEGEMTSAGDQGDNGNVNNRFAYAGIGGDFGRVVFGKSHGALGMLTDTTDILHFHGNEVGGKIAAGDRTGSNLSYLGSFEVGGNNLVLRANYAFDIATQDTTSSNSEGYSVGAMYNMEMGLGFGIGHAEQNRVDDEKQTQSFASITYQTGGLYLAGLYQDSSNFRDFAGQEVEESTGYELTAAYTIDKLRIAATHNYLEDTERNLDVKDMVAVEAAYYFKPNFRVFTSYKFEGIEGKSDQVMVGTRFLF